MMKKIASAFLISLARSIGFAQNPMSPTDSLKQQLSVAKDDTSRILKMAEICHEYGYSNNDSSVVYGQQALELLKLNNFPRGKARVLFGLGCNYLVHGDISKALGIFWRVCNWREKTIAQQYRPKRTYRLEQVGR
jgi:hypothetical protein